MCNCNRRDVHCTGALSHLVQSHKDKVLDFLKLQIEQISRFRLPETVAGQIHDW